MDASAFRFCFNQKSWQQADPEDLAIHWDLITPMTDAGFRYWIPAFIVLDLDGGGSGLAAMSMASKILPNEQHRNKIRPNPFRVSLDSFSTAELLALANYLDWCSELCDVDEFTDFADASRIVRNQIEA